MSQISSVVAREILDSRGNPTLEVKITLENAQSAKASVPSGASTGVHEALELRDGDEKRYLGKGVLKAVKNVNEKIAPVITGMSAIDQQKVDQKMIELDGTKNKSNLGANAILGVSLACARIGALASNLPLYGYINQTYNFQQLTSGIRNLTPMFNILNGGKHAHNQLDIQEFMILPVKEVSFAEKVRLGAEVFLHLGKLLKSKNYLTNVGDEGGYAPAVSSGAAAIELILEAVKNAGYEPGADIGLGLDVAASELYDENKSQYSFKSEQANLVADQVVEMYVSWSQKYPLVSIEDGLAQDDWSGWQVLNQRLGSRTCLIGDDLFVTNIERLRQGLEQKAANAILIKVNQIGTITETIECIKLAQASGYKVAVSHRSGETADDFIADLAIAVGADYLKAGSLSRGERVVKYNRVMEIEQSLMSKV